MCVSKDYKTQLPKESSVCIILRHHGDILGTGVGSGESLHPLVDAATLAFKETNTHQIFSKLSSEMKKHACNSISIELELGEKPIASPSKSLARFAEITTASDGGVGVRRGNKWDIRLPAILRLSPKRDIENILTSLCMNVGVHPSAAISRQLPIDDDVTLYTIPTLGGVQNVANGDIQQLFQGDELVEQKVNASISFVELANMLAAHLIASTGESGNVIGAYQPETDSLPSPLASPFVQIMVATALLEYADLHAASLTNNARRSASRILNDIKKTFHTRDEIPNDVAAAVVIANMSNATELFYNTCTEQIIQLAIDITDGSVVVDKPHTFALVALAMGKLAKRNESQHDNLAEKICLRCLDEVSLQSKVSTIPWIVEAVIELRNNGIKVDTAALDELLNLVIASQIVEGNQPELIGGFQLSSPDGVVADARGVRILPMLVQLSECKSSEALRSLMLTTRFVTQLTTRKERAQRFQNPAMAIGGVRASMSDATMPTEATAMALIGITRAANLFHSQ